MERAERNETDPFATDPAFPTGRGQEQRRETMTYVEGFVLAVPTAQKEEYRKHAADAAALVKEFGVRRHVEAWGDEVPAGKLNDFRTAVQAKEGRSEEHTSELQSLMRTSYAVFCL